MLLTASSCLAQTTQPAALPTPTDAQVEQAINKGIGYLLSRQLRGGSLDTRYKEQFAGGPEALLAVSAMSAGQGPDQQAVKALIESALRSQPHTVYARSQRMLLCTAILAQPKNTPETIKECNDHLSEDSLWLVKQMNVNGGWGYGAGHPTMVQQPKWTDNSNSQMAVLALIEAAETGVKVSPAVWRSSLNYWTKAQNADGGWGYEPPGGTAQPLRKSSYGTMTASAVASLMLLDQKLAVTDPTLTKNVDAPLGKGLRWMQEHYLVSGIPQWSWGSSDIYNDYYFLYVHSLARAGELAGWRDLAGQCWWSDLAAYLVSRQRGDGSWTDPEDSPSLEEGRDGPIRTAMAIQALSSIRRAPLMNKLVFGGESDYDALNLVSHVRRTLGWQVTWQALGASQSQCLGEAPILYMSGPADLWAKDSPKITPELAAAIRDYVFDGGVILVNPVGDKSPQLAAEMFASLLPELKVGVLPDNHPVYTLRQKVAGEKKIKIAALSDGERTAVFVLDRDLSAVWNTRDISTQPHAFDLALNLALYATDQTCPSDRFNRLRRAARPSTAPSRVIHVARLRHDGNWNAWPQALPRLGQVLSASCSVGVKEELPCDLSGDLPDGLNLLWITGNALPNLDDARLGRLKKFIAAGGTVLVDSAAGSKALVQQAQTLADKLLGAKSLKPLAADDGLITGKFSEAAGDVSAVTYSPAVTAENPDMKSPSLLGATSGGSLGLIVSPYSLSAPLADAGFYGIRSYSKADARRLAANIALYAATRTR